MADAVYDGWYALRGEKDEAARAARARRAAALYEIGMTWPEMRKAMRCDYTALSALIHEGGADVGSRNRSAVHVIHPDHSSLQPVERWTREIQRAPSPGLDAALAAHTAAIVRMHNELGLDPPRLP